MVPEIGDLSPPAVHAYFKNKIRPSLCTTPLCVSSPRTRWGDLDRIWPWPISASKVLFYVVCFADISSLRSYLLVLQAHNKVKALSNKLRLFVMGIRLIQAGMPAVTVQREGPSCRLIMTWMTGWFVSAGHPDPSLTRFSNVKTFNGLCLCKAGT